MMGRMPFAESFIFFLRSKKRFHTFHFKFHFDIGGQFIDHFLHGITSVFFGIQCGTDSSEKMRVLRIDNMFIIQL